MVGSRGHLSLGVHSLSHLVVLHLRLFFGCLCWHFGGFTVVSASGLSNCWCYSQSHPSCTFGCGNCQSVAASVQRVPCLSAELGDCLQPFRLLRDRFVLSGYEWEPQSVGLLPSLRLSLIHLGVPGPSTPSTAVLNEQALAELSILDWLLGVAWTPATSEKLGAPSKEVCFVPKSPKGFWSKSSKLFLN